jgi:hypothetical protein
MPTPHPALSASLVLLAGCASSSVASRNLTGTPAPDSKVVVGKVELAENVLAALSAARADKLETNSDAWLQVFKSALQAPLNEAGLTTAGGAELKVDVLFTEVDPGSKAARYWVGFGAGTGRVSATVTVGSHGSFTVAGKLSGGWFGGELDGVMEKLGEDAGEEIARLVKGGPD